MMPIQSGGSPSHHSRTRAKPWLRLDHTNGRYQAQVVSTKTSTTRPGLSSLTYSSKHPSRNVSCVRSSPSTNRFMTLRYRTCYASIEDNRVFTQPGPKPASRELEKQTFNDQIERMRRTTPGCPALSGSSNQLVGPHYDGLWDVDAELLGCCQVDHQPIDAGLLNRKLARWRPL